MARVVRVVALASGSGRYGGPFDTSLRQVRIARDNGFEAVLVAAYESGDEPALDSSSTAIVKLFPAKNWVPAAGFAAIYSLRVFRALLVNIRAADVVHISFAREMVPLTAMAIAVLMGKRIVAQPHGMLTSRTSWLHSAMDIVVRPLLTKANIVIALTEVEATELRSWLKGRRVSIVTLGNPVPDSVVPRLRQAPLRLEALFVARLHPRKRVSVFLDAARYAEQMGWPEEYVVVGPDGGDLEIVQEAAATVHNTSYEGAMSADGVTTRVQQAGVFVLSSEKEPWGNVVALAMSSGVPVVVPASAALAPNVAEFNAGKVVSDNDAQAIAKAVHELLESSAHAQASAGALAFAAAELTRAHQLRMLENIYSPAVR